MSTAFPVFDRDDFLKRLGGDERLFVTVVRLFLEDCPERLAEITSAIHARDAERIRCAAHALKGEAGTMSARGLFDAAREMEQIGVDGHFDAADEANRRLSAAASDVMDSLSRDISRLG